MRPARTTTFFVATYLITWGLQLPSLLALWGVLPGPPERFLRLMGLSAFGPMFGAMVASRVGAGGDGVRALFRPLGVWRVSPVWYLAALLGPGALFVAARAVYVLLGGHDAGPWLYPPVEPERVIAAVVFSLGEEVGWRGFALPRLQDRYGAVRASAILGVLWACWHLPMFLLSGLTVGTLVALIPFFIAGSVVFTWIYNRTGASLLLAVLTHVGAHLNNTHRALPAHTTPAVLHTAGYLVAALALIAYDRTLGAPARRG